MSISPRPPVTQYEAYLIHKVVTALSESETFYLSGTLDLANLGVSEPALFYSVNAANGGTPSAKVLPLCNPSTNALDDLHTASSPSPFGHGQETVYDEAYRLAREIRADKFNFNFDPLATSTGVLAAVSAFTAPTAGGASDLAVTGVEAKLYKLNSYTTGGHFKKHRDTPKATNHIGTLLFGIPAAFEGGELILTHESAQGSKTVTIDWSKVDAPSGALRLPWIFFYSDVQHEIFPVKSGNRLTVAYDIFATETVRYRVPADPAKSTARSDALYAELMAALGDKEFLDKGGKLAFALSYQYPAEEMESVKNAAFGSILKGNDYLLAHTLASLSLTSEIRAVYPPMRPPKEHLLNQLKNLVSSGNPVHDLDAFSSFGIVKTTDPQPDYPPAGSRLPAGSALYTARNFNGINENSCVESEEEGSDGEPVGPLVEWTGASVDFELIWARRPVKGTFAVASTYARYGNEASTSHSYVAGALVVEIPAFGEGSRKTEGGMKL